MTLRPIEILFDTERTQFDPGNELTGQFLVVPEDARSLKAVELSILWYTEGKGDEDIGVHHFERIDAQDGANDLRRPIPFRTRLPNSPLSYHGSIIKIVWCVRVRAFVHRGDDLVAEERFQLGSIPSIEQLAAK
jgi:hypothetical protein